MNRHGITLLVSTIAFWLLMIAGCSEPQLKLVTPVEGKISAGEQPLAAGNITFHPDTSKGNNAKYSQLPVGSISDGTYSIATGGKPGAPEGWYKVTLTSSVPSDPKDEYSIPKLVVDQAYTDAATTTLLIEVKEGAGAGAYDLKVPKN
jgi:hypothetical protein